MNSYRNEGEEPIILDYIFLKESRTTCITGTES
jgi:hypothetical protein